MSRPRLRAPLAHLAYLLSICLLTPPLLAGELTLTGVEPTPRGLTASVDSAIILHFDRPIARASIVPRRSLWAFGRWSGAADGVISYADGDQTVILQPARLFSAGEQVMVVLSNQIQAVDGTPLRPEGYSFQFWTRAQPSGLDFVEADRFSTRTTAGQSSRAYGGFASDLDEDGFLDLTIVNEDTDDLRVFLNQGDGSATFAAMLPPSGTGNVPSPSEPSDFNADGHVDVAVANTAGASVSILLGQGDGTFGPQQQVTVGGTPRGIAVLDADGDGDIDVVNTNHTDNSLSLLRNDGNGQLSVASTFGSTRDGEWALAAADMDGDGILDLVVGGQDSQTLRVYLGNGDGTFTALAPFPCGGRVWMVVLGDLDGDGNEDATVANSSSNNGAVLLGNGLGGFSAPITYGTDPFPLANDLGDLDGDGDLDWITASFSGDWFVFANDGSGAFTFDQELAASQAASCSLAFDADNDGDLDLALIDEIADEVIVMIHPETPPLFADGFESGDSSAWDQP